MLGDPASRSWARLAESAKPLRWSCRPAEPAAPLRRRCRLAKVRRVHPYAPPAACNLRQEALKPPVAAARAAQCCYYGCSALSWPVTRPLRRSSLDRTNLKPLFLRGEGPPGWREPPLPMTCCRWCPLLPSGRIERSGAARPDWEWQRGCWPGVLLSCPGPGSCPAPSPRREGWLAPRLDAQAKDAFPYCRVFWPPRQ